MPAAFGPGSGRAANLLTASAMATGIPGGLAINAYRNWQSRRALDMQIGAEIEA